ncbi:MAG: OsmC family protein [Promicromonosporaceae bacterium]|nr:OsmC family protein [Promicromonosporaceae bacterium]
MSEPTTAPLDGDDVAPMSPVPTDPLWAERTGTRTYTGFNGRGASVSIGPVEAGAVFTPGELLKIALAACAGMSADTKFSRVLGNDFQLTIRVDGPKHETEDRYTGFNEVFEIDLSSLDDTAREKTLLLAQRSIDRACTVGNTLRASAEVPPVKYAQPSDGESLG